MRIIVFSDSHGKTNRMHNVLLKESFDMILHLGDCYDDMLELESCYDVPVHGVVGNIDRNEELSHKTIMIEGHAVYMCHGHHYRVKRGYEILDAHAASIGCDLALFGHTHQTYYRKHKCLLLNPGSISMPIGHDFPSYAILEITNKEISCEIKYLNFS